MSFSTASFSGFSATNISTTGRCVDDRRCRICSRYPGGQLVQAPLTSSSSLRNSCLHPFPSPMHTIASAVHHFGGRLEQPVLGAFLDQGVRGLEVLVGRNAMRTAVSPFDSASSKGHSCCVRAGRRELYRLRLVSAAERQEALADHVPTTVAWLCLEMSISSRPSSFSSSAPFSRVLSDSLVDNILT